MQPGTIVRFREREWVLLPVEGEELVRLRPLTGLDDEAILVHRGLCLLLGSSLPSERIESAAFPLPDPTDIGAAIEAELLWNAARLTLRDGAAPIRSLGKISIRPRTYQFVPLLMSLRLDPVRLFIADDVGVGKTIEALLVARELIERGEIRRFAVLCPPYLCDQWKQEIREKFHLEAVVVRPGTLSALQRELPHGRSVFEHYPYLVLSIDWVKGERVRHQFLQHCPELVIVDEVHGASASRTASKEQQRRHQLLREIATDPRRHLVLLTATPHSGIEEAFQSLLGLLDPRFATWKYTHLTEEQRATLARHFVQRTRRDIQIDWHEEHAFPRREATDLAYELSPAYRKLFDATYAFCFDLVHERGGLTEPQRRVRYWGALALLRCVMSSPRAALMALDKRIEKEQHDPGKEVDLLLEAATMVYEGDDAEVDDETPLPPIEAAFTTLATAERNRTQRHLAKLLKLAKGLAGNNADTKLRTAVAAIAHLLEEGFHPIVWCRYVATAEYVAEQLQRHLPASVHVLCVTGRMGEEERRAAIASLDAEQPHVLVATDCLSEGINLQERFTAVLHYDLPWNPNRLEQREGRVDRYGQRAPVVKVVRFFGRDNPIDGAVLEVLLRKAEEIRKALGTYVPIPEDSESVLNAVLNSLFQYRRSDPEQLQLALELPARHEIHLAWERAKERELVNRTRFAQRALKPEVVQKEVEATDRLLGDPQTVRRFVLAAAEWLGLPIEETTDPDVYAIIATEDRRRLLPDAIAALLRGRGERWRVAFVSPTPAGATYLGRNHPFVAGLARYLFEASLTTGREPRLPRCGAIRTDAVASLTVLALLRARYLLHHRPGEAPLLAEEVPLVAIELRDHRWLPEAEALRLLTEAKPTGNVPRSRKEQLVTLAFEELELERPQGPFWTRTAEALAARARELAARHQRLREALRTGRRRIDVVPQDPPDLLGLLVLQPQVGGR